MFLTHPETVKNTPLPIPWLEEPEGPNRTEKDRIDGESVGIRIVEPSHEIVKEGADFSGVNRSDKVHPAADIIASNRSVVLQAYSPDTHLQKIQELYRAVVLAPVQEVHYISGADLLGQFLKNRNSSPYSGCRFERFPSATRPGSRCSGLWRKEESCCGADSLPGTPLRQIHLRKTRLTYP